MTPPELDERIKGHKGYGLIQLIHGPGKGKSTAALGQVVRCAGAGRRAIIIYFDKGGQDHYSERGSLDKFDNIEYLATGRDRIDPDSGRFDFSVTELDRQEAEKGLALAREVLTSGVYDLVVLDEINSTVQLKMLAVEDVISALENKDPETEVILTGRNPKEELIKIAHLISKVEMERHYFYSGVPAREGLDY
ncbi:MAG: cob(I)yrinic acid a,c-diamide adenosyltransferase [Patescibacteria group bacterium]|nr:cob(I)yrinic acid a,c-diamide adenosyltransferase [Patescibacteria group bacterium]